MTIETCLTIMVINQLLIVMFLVFIFFKVQSSIKNFYHQVEKTFVEANQLFTNLNEFVASDLHSASSEFTGLLAKTSVLVSDLNSSQKVANFFLKPLGELKSGKTSLSSEEESEDEKSPVSETIKWVSRGWILFKSIRRLVKNHEK